MLLPRRHYERVEKQFVEAKMDLHKKEDQKEQLTEHLYTIIHQNELRKAKKLEDLMKKLELETAGEDVPQESSAQLPQLAVINPMQAAKCSQSVPVSPQALGGQQPLQQTASPELQTVTAQPQTEAQIKSTLEGRSQKEQAAPDPEQQCSSNKSPHSSSTQVSETAASGTAGDTWKQIRKYFTMLVVSLRSFPFTQWCLAVLVCFHCRFLWSFVVH